MPMAQGAAKVVETTLNHEVQVYYAGDFLGSSAIHPDIWTHILQADMLVADITGYNPNVMYELGVAAAWRPQSTILIVRDKCDGEQFAFDLQPARQIVYDSSSRDWMEYLRGQLIVSLFACLAQVPFSDEPSTETPTTFEVSLADGKDTDYLWSPGPGHRRLLSDGLEFGSPYYFPYSWLSPPRLRPANVQVQAEMRFSLRDDPCWIGIALRSQGYLAGNGTEQLVWLRQDGDVYRTGPSVVPQDKDEHNIGRLSVFNPSDDQFVSFSVSIDNKEWQISVGDVSVSIPIAELPHVFPEGRIMFQTFRCRAVIKNIKVRAL